jgi:hypothetical protein
MAKWQLIVPALLGGSVVAGGTAAYFYFKGIPAQVGINPSASAAIVPDEALMTSFISGDDQAWGKLKKFGTPEAQQLFAEGYDDFISSFEQSATAQNIDVEKDVRPWLGSIMVALMPAEKKAEPQALLVVGVKDKLAALKFANKMKENAESTIKEEEYKGVKVLADSKSSAFVGILEHHLLVTLDRKALELALDTSKGAPSLAARADGAMTEALTDFKNPVAQVYIPDYSAFFQQFTAASATPLPPQVLDQLDRQLDQVKSVAIAMGIDDQGLQMRAITAMSPEAKQWNYKPIPGKVLGEFPEDTLALVSGGGISESWATSRQLTQLDLDQDILGWMDGEFALGLIPSQEGLLADVGFGGALLLETSDRTTAEKTFGKLDNLATQNLLKLNQRDINSIPVTEWQIPVQGTLVSHGWLDQDISFMALGGPMADILVSKPERTLSSSKVFQAATASFPKKNSGYFYLNMEQASGLLTSNPLIAQSGWLTPDTKAILQSIQAVGATTSQIDDSTLKTDIVMTLQPASK